MKRRCLTCRRPFDHLDLCHEVSRNIEAERKARGVQGILFRCYACAECGAESLFVDLQPLDNETDQELHRRREELAMVIGQLPQGAVAVGLVERQDPWPGPDFLIHVEKPSSAPEKA